MGAEDRPRSLVLFYFIWFVTSEVRAFVARRNYDGPTMKRVFHTFICAVDIIVIPQTTHDTTLDIA